MQGWNRFMYFVINLRKWLFIITFHATLRKYEVALHKVAHIQSQIRQVARISSRKGPTWRGPKVPLIKNQNSSDLAHYCFGPAQSLFIFSFLL